MVEDVNLNRLKKYSTLVSKVNDNAFPSDLFYDLKSWNFEEPVKVYVEPGKKARSKKKYSVVATTMSSVSPLSIANWSLDAAKYAELEGKVDVAKQLVEFGKENENETDPGHLYTEIGGYFSAALDLRRAQMDLTTVAHLTEQNIDDATKEMSTSALDRLDLMVTTAIFRVKGMVTDALRSLSDGVKNLKDHIVNFSMSAKNLVQRAFEDLVQRFLDVISEFIDAMFSFVKRIQDVGSKKGFKLKSVDISLDPPSFTTVTVFGFPVPLPDISLPKLDMQFDLGT